MSNTVLLSPLEIGISKKCTNDVYCHFTCSKGWSKESYVSCLYVKCEESGEESIDGETEKRPGVVGSESTRPKPLGFTYDFFGFSGK